MVFLKLVPEPGRGLSDDLQMMNEPGLDQFIVLKGTPAFCRVPFDELNRFQHVHQARAAVSHRGMASWSTLSRTRGLRPRSLTTSTSQSRSC